VSNRLPPVMALAALALALAGGARADPVAAALVRHGCAACHEIPGIPGATGRVGPPLGGFSRQAYIAGRLPNDRDALVRWLLDPAAIKPGTAMPATGLDARTAGLIADRLRRPP
jgi:cytochrome c